jgi:hypothetical protein
VLSALAIQRSGISEPTGIHGFLAPATRHTAHPGVAESLLRSVGRTIAVRRKGELQIARGWMEAREFRSIQRYGRLMEMADAFTLPRVYPSLRDVDFWVNPNVIGAGLLLGVIPRVQAFLPAAIRFARFGMPLARFLGSNEGTLAYEIEGAAGEQTSVVFTGRESYLMAVIPAALAAARLAAGEPCDAGVVPVHQHVDFAVLEKALTRYGIHLEARVNASR